MDYTKNYHLPQWVKEDRIMMEDFNQMCADIESGIMDARTRAEAGDAAVQKAAAAALAQAQSGSNAAAAKAQAAADAAQETADAALEKASAAFSLDNLPCVMGSYIGTGQNIDVEVGFRPSFLVLWGTGNQGQSTPSTFVTLTDGKHGGSILSMTATGFRVLTGAYADTTNASGLHYWYLAFR